jgi:hypothetical protein
MGTAATVNVVVFLVVTSSNLIRIGIGSIVTRSRTIALEPSPCFIIDGSLLKERKIERERYIT